MTPAPHSDDQETEAAASQLGRLLDNWDSVAGDTTSLSEEDRAYLAKFPSGMHRVLAERHPHLTGDPQVGTAADIEDTLQLYEHFVSQRQAPPLSAIGDRLWQVAAAEARMNESLRDRGALPGARKARDAAVREFVAFMGDSAHAVDLDPATTPAELERAIALFSHLIERGEIQDISVLTHLLWDRALAETWSTAATPKRDEIPQLDEQIAAITHDLVAAQRSHASEDTLADLEEELEDARADHEAAVEVCAHTNEIWDQVADKAIKIFSRNDIEWFSPESMGPDPSLGTIDELREALRWLADLAVDMWIEPATTLVSTLIDLDAYFIDLSFPDHAPTPQEIRTSSWFQKLVSPAIEQLHSRIAALFRGDEDWPEEGEMPLFLQAVHALYFFDIRYELTSRRLLNGWRSEGVPRGQLPPEYCALEGLPPITVGDIRDTVRQAYEHLYPPEPGEEPVAPNLLPNFSDTTRMDVYFQQRLRLALEQLGDAGADTRSMKAVRAERALPRTLDPATGSQRPAQRPVQVEDVSLEILDDSSQPGEDNSGKTPAVTRMPVASQPPSPAPVLPTSPSTPTGPAAATKGADSYLADFDISSLPGTRNPKESSPAAPVGASPDQMRPPTQLTPSPTPPPATAPESRPSSPPGPLSRRPPSNPAPRTIREQSVPPSEELCAVASDVAGSMISGRIRHPMIILRAPDEVEIAPIVDAVYDAARDRVSRLRWEIGVNGARDPSIKAIETLLADQWTRKRRLARDSQQARLGPHLNDAAIRQRLEVVHDPAAVYPLALVEETKAAVSDLRSSMLVVVTGLERLHVDVLIRLLDPLALAVQTVSPRLRVIVVTSEDGYQTIRNAVAQRAKGLMQAGAAADMADSRRAQAVAALLAKKIPSGPLRQPQKSVTAKEATLG